MAKKLTRPEEQASYTKKWLPTLLILGRSITSAAIYVLWQISFSTEIWQMFDLPRYWQLPTHIVCLTCIFVIFVRYPFLISATPKNNTATGSNAVSPFEKFISKELYNSKDKVA